MDKDLTTSKIDRQNILNNSEAINEIKIQTGIQGIIFEDKSYIRIFFMERFMERVSLSNYRENFVLKGGMLVRDLIRPMED